MSFKNRFLSGATGAILVTAAMSAAIPAQADDSGAFIGGMLTSRVLGNMSARTQAEQQQAAASQQMAQQQQAPAAAPAPAAQSPEQKLDELNKLAAGGYITPEEYKTKKAAILNAM